MVPYIIYHHCLHLCFLFVCYSLYLWKLISFNSDYVLLNNIVVCETVDYFKLAQKLDPQICFSTHSLVPKLAQLGVRTVILATLDPTFFLLTVSFNKPTVILNVTRKPINILKTIYI